MKVNKWYLPVAAGIVLGYMAFGTQATDQKPDPVTSQQADPGHSQAYENWLTGNAGFKKPADSELQKTLTGLQYRVTQEDGTERAFRNSFWDNKQAGIYVDIVSGEPLFSSTDKYRSGTGWPSFTRPIHSRAMVTREDRSWFGVRTELRSAMADSHLGHLFDDGPAPAGLRYCINSASLRFIPKEDLVREGYAEFLTLFEE